MEMKFSHWLILFLAIASVVSSCKKDDQEVVEDGEVLLKAEEGEELSGGKLNTVYNFSVNAFSLPSPGLDNMDELNFAVGNSFFKKNWVAAPASTTARDGLGPLFNARSCSACHLRDGRGQPAKNTDGSTNGLLLRLSIPGAGPNGGPNPHQNYGGQLQDQGIGGVPAEGKITINYTTIRGEFSDGTPYELIKPEYTIDGSAYGDLNDALISPRIGQQIIGMGLLEAIDEADLLALVDESDADMDGISGKPNYVWDQVEGTMSLGRFGWKANQPSVEQQTAGAFLGDLGITTSIFPDQNCTGAQTACQNAADGGTPEIEDDDLQKTVLYTSNLSVPARRNPGNQEVLKGKKTFAEIGCAKCHVPTFTTGIHQVFDNLSGQKIWPYTDLLLHDMGEDLADHRPDFEATGSEWRTPPLWGIGLIETVNHHTNFLHDGRARNIEEAILWHGGEAEDSQQKYKALSQTRRDELLKFLNSL